MYISGTFSRPFARTSAPFFWLTKMMMGGSTPPFKISINLFLFALSAIMYTTCRETMVNGGPDTTDTSFKLDFDLFNPLHRSSHTANVHNCRPSQVGSKTIKNVISIKIFLQKQLYLASLSTGGGMVAENMTWRLVG